MVYLCVYLNIGKGMINLELSIRNENEGEFRAVEELTREAFWNLYVPGCDEHYLAHVMRNHPDFIRELDFVAVYENRIIGNIMYAKSYVVDVDADDSARKLDTISFGPVCVLPEFQKKGVGSAIISHSIEKAKEDGYNAVIIQGHPHNYCKHGFKSAMDLRISDSDGRYPFGLLALELKRGVFEGYDWRYVPSDVYDVDADEVAKFDKTFKFKKKEYRYTQEEFSIACRAYLDRNPE